LDAADVALHAGAESLPAAEIATRSQRLNSERAQTLRLLTAVARQRGVPTRFLHLLPRRHLRRILDLPIQVQACVFELEGVLVPSVALHVAAWQQAFDQFLNRRTDPAGRPIGSFHPRTDYLRYLHGKPRLDGVTAFLESRGITAPVGTPQDPPGTPSVYGIANRKQDALVHLIETRGVRSFEESLSYLETAKEAGLATAVVSASANTDRILAGSGLLRLVDASIDGRAMVEEHLQPSPAPDVLLAACRALNVEPDSAAAYETTSDGVVAAHAAGFAVVFAVGGIAHAPGLHTAGSDRVVPDLGALLETRLAS
jgi:beta-phosphoglucomutase-like phosphatase (HAD superfamily)